MTTKIEHFQPKNFIRLEWDGNELTCFGRRGNGEEARQSRAIYGFDER